MRKLAEQLFPHAGIRHAEQKAEKSNNRHIQNKSEQPISDASYWKMVNTISVIAAIVLLIYEITIYVMSPAPLNVEHLLPALLLMGLTFGLTWRTYPFAMLFLSVWSIVASMPTFNGAAFILTALSCIVMIIVNCSGKELLFSFCIPLLLLTVSMGVLVSRNVVPSYQIRDAVLQLMGYIFQAALLGMLIRNIQRLMQVRVQAAQLQVEKQRAEQLERNVRLASQMHDGLTNDLSFIATIAYSHILQERSFTASEETGQENTAISLSSPSSPSSSPSSQSSPSLGNSQLATSSDWQHVYDEAQDALDKAHFAIDRLRGKPEPVDEVADARGPLQQAVPRIANREKAKLDALGFASTVDVELAGIPDTISVRARQEVIQLVTEVFANIRRHASVDGTYSVSLLFAPDCQALKLVAMNTLSSRSRGGKSGRGLQLHQHIIEQLGGSLETSIDDDVWIVRATIPLLAE
ncbi:hypothetical protein [Aeriscardovia aeriphila]|uniref:Histidine kinase n=1 Tax=Aeriscardovia aeriphila TaxID=218139 RepID=A0A261FD07_9BIFI|nr:hypothetical protein [Aeriscardovia aeriphila]NYI26231.1 hypothetical protein [Aeriscardovia aeriphila]OZG56776.1 histidine kinase [Aeriscardovia aeriphila]